MVASPRADGIETCQYGGRLPTSRGQCPTMVTPSAPRFEHHRVALGIGEATPRLSWKTTADAGWRQEAYQLELTRGTTMWVGARTTSADSVLVPWPADAL